jgi:Secretion system C-terminal sorting domain
VNPGEGYSRTILRPSYVCLLSWVTNPLNNGSTYGVTVETFVSGVWSGFCGASCNVTILNPPANQSRALETVVATSEEALEIYPNPTRDGRATLKLNGLVDMDHAISVEVLDLFGKRVSSEQFRVNGDSFNTVLNLDGVSSGIYLVNVTVDGVLTTKRISLL